MPIAFINLIIAIIIASDELAVCIEYCIDDIIIILSVLEYSNTRVHDIVLLLSVLEYGISTMGSN